MKKLLLPLLLALLFYCQLSAKHSHIQAAFIDDILGARAWGLGGAYRTLVNDAGAIIWNPAGLIDLKGSSSISLEHLELIEFFSYSYLGYAQKRSEQLSWGTALFYSGDEAMSEFIGYVAIALDGAKMGDIIHSGIIPEGLVNLGVTTKFYYASYGNNQQLQLPDYLIGHQVSGSATGFGLDLGLKIKPTRKDHFSLTFQNLINNIRWDSQNSAGTALGKYCENLPVRATIGYARHQNNFLLALEIDKGLYYDLEDELHLGLEFVLRRELTLRSGYAQELVTADNKRLGLGAGISIGIPSLRSLRLDVTYLMHLEWEGYNSLLFSLTL